MKKYSLFSNKIIDFSKICNCFLDTEHCILTNSYQHVKSKLLYTCSTVTTSSNFLGISEDKMYDILLQDNGLYTIICWINKNILIQLDTLESKTLEVRLRIATSMLNKVIQQQNINNLVGIIIHDNFVKNIKELYYDLNTDQLPF